MQERWTFDKIKLPCNILITAASSINVGATLAVEILRDKNFDSIILFNAYVGNYNDIIPHSFYWWHYYERDISPTMLQLAKTLYRQHKGKEHVCIIWHDFEPSLELLRDAHTYNLSNIVVITNPIYSVRPPLTYHHSIHMDRSCVLDRVGQKSTLCQYHSERQRLPFYKPIYDVLEKMHKYLPGTFRLPPKIDTTSPGRHKGHEWCVLMHDIRLWDLTKYWTPNQVYTQCVECLSVVLFTFLPVNILLMHITLPYMGEFARITDYIQFVHIIREYQVQ